MVPSTITSPATCSSAVGEVVPIPTLDVLPSTTNISDPAAQLLPICTYPLVVPSAMCVTAILLAVP